MEPRFGLRRILLADGIVCGAFGVLLAFGSSPLSDLLGMPTLLLRLVGSGLPLYAIALILLATRTTVRRDLAWGVVGLNLLWAVASAALLLTGWLAPTALGVVFTLAQAILVAAFADIQYLALRRSAG
jgi:hypothetical protein